MNLLDSSEVAVVLIARLFLGLVFLPSAFGKLVNQRGFIQGTVDYQVLPERTARLIGFILPWIELVLALALIGGVALSIAGFVASFLLVCFITAVVINLQRGREIKCNCYGVAGTKTVSWGIVVRNVFLLVIAVVLIALAPNITSPDQWLIMWNTAYSIISSVAAAILLILLLSFCFVTVQLAEWSLDIYHRISRLNI